MIDHPDGQIIVPAGRQINRRQPSSARSLFLLFVQRDTKATGSLGFVTREESLGTVKGFYRVSRGCCRRSSRWTDYNSWKFYISVIFIAFPYLRTWVSHEYYLLFLTGFIVLLIVIFLAYIYRVLIKDDCSKPRQRRKFYTRRNIWVTLSRVLFRARSICTHAILFTV